MYRSWRKWFVARNMEYFENLKVTINIIREKNESSFFPHIASK